MSATPAEAKLALHKERERVFSAKRRHASPMETVHAFTKVVDRALRDIYHSYPASQTLEEHLCLVALGGYGRGELCPYSDVDLLLLRSDTAASELIAGFVRRVWDSGMNTGVVVRTTQESARILGEELASDTAFIDCTHIVGSVPLFSHLRAAVLGRYFSRNRQGFIRALRTDLHERVHSSVNTLFRVEPDLKDGICALRDCQRLMWAERVSTGVLGGDRHPPLGFLGEEERDTLNRAYAFLISVRNELHMLCRRRMDVLEVGLQEAVADSLGFGSPTALMERYFGTVSDVRHCILRFLEHSPGHHTSWEALRRHVGALRVEPGMVLVDGILYPRIRSLFEHGNAALTVLSVFRAAITCHATFSIALRNRIREVVSRIPREDFRTEEVDLAFRELLALHKQVGRILRLMHETGFLEGLIPEFGPLTNKVEYDTYHEYTVDQHTLLALSAYDELSREPDDLLRAVYLNVPNKPLLRLAILLHDIGKALPGDHAQTGALIAENIGSRLGLTRDEQQRLRFLVYSHLRVSELSLLRQLEEPVLRAFAEEVGDRENLDMLFVLTVLDIRHVGTGTWTGWKAAQLAELYTKAAEALEGDAATAPLPAVPDPLGLGPAYIQTTLPEDRALHREWLESGDSDHLQLHQQDLVGFVRLTAIGRDRKGFLADFIGCLYSQGLNVLRADVYSTTDGRALDIFHVEPDLTTQVPMDTRLERVRGAWERVNSRKATAQQLVRDRLQRYPPKPRRPSDLTPSCSFDNETSELCTIIELRAIDRPGLLHDIATTLSGQQVTTVSAHIATDIDRAIDVFYVTDSDGGKLRDEAAMQALESELLALANV